MSRPQHNPPLGGKSSAAGGSMSGIRGKSSDRVNKVALQDVARQRFADMLREVFPGKHDAETAAKAAQVLGYSKDTVRNWLDCKNEPPFGVFFAIQARFGAGRAIDLITLGEGQKTLWGRITGRGGDQ